MNVAGCGWLALAAVVPLASGDTLCSVLPSLCDGKYESRFLTLSMLGLSGTLPKQMAMLTQLVPVLGLGPRTGSPLSPLDFALLSSRPPAL